MSICPHCDAEVIPGNDVCDECGQPLMDLHLTEPQTEVASGLLKDRIGYLNPRQPLTVASTATVRQVVDQMAQKGVGCVLVLEKDRPVGIFTDRDVLRKVGIKLNEVGQRPISDFMTPNPQTLERGAKIAFAVQRMDQGGYRHVPVTSEDGQIDGIISVRDILRYLAAKMAPDTA